MNKKFLNVILFGALMLGSTGTFVSCKDYDDDIDNLQKQIDANKTALDQINELIGSGSVITGVDENDKGIVIKLSNGKSYPITNGTNGTPGSVVSIGENGNWYIDGKDTEKPSRGEQGPAGGSGTSASTIYYTPGTSGDEEGFWVKVTVATDGTTKREITKDKWLPVGTITAVADDNTVTLFNVSGVEGGKVVLARSNSFLSSLSYMTTNINEDLGKVAFFPIIGYDKCSWEDKPVYEHNASKKDTKEDAKYITMYEGWLTMNFKVNPSTISKDAFTVLGFDHGKAYTTRALADNLTIGEWKLDNGTLSVPVKGLQMKHYGETFDDPLVANGGKGIKQDDKFGNQVDELALQVKNNKESAAADGVVSSEYITMKRMVVEQEDVMIGVNKDINLDKAVELNRDLHRIYPVAWSATDKNTYKANLPVNINVPFTGTTDLNEYLEKYAIQINTNTGKTIGKGLDQLEEQNSQWQATLEELGFDNLSLEYEIEPYTKAQVDQSQGAEIYDKEEVMKYLVLNGSKVSFHQENTAAIEREPMIKVSLYAGEGDNKILVMTKLLKLKVINKVQEEELQVPLDHLKDQILPCEIFGGENTLGGYIDMDKVFNALKMSKTQFVNTYIKLKLGWPYYPNRIADIEIVRYEKAGTKGADGIPVGVNKITDQHVSGHVSVDGENIEYYETATFQKNRLPLNINTTALPGYYTVKITYNTSSTEAAYKQVVIYDDFRIDYPETSLTYNPNMWNGTENMLVYGHATNNSDYDNPLVMEGFLENGFTKYTGSSCPKATSTLHFEIITDNSEEGKYNKNNFYADGAWRVAIEQVTDGTGAIKHKIVLDNTWDATAGKYGNFKYADMVNKNIKVRAYSIFNGIVDCPDHTATTPVCGTAKAHRADCVNNATNSAIFDVKFVDPVAFASYTNDKWYLIDKAPSTAEYGYQIPLYRLFRVYDTHKSTTNGIIWEPTQLQGWWEQGSNKDKVGEGLRGLHGLKITYVVDIAKNKVLADDGVLTNVRVDGLSLTNGKVESEGPGILTWVNSGDAVISAQPIVVTIKAYYGWAPTDYTEHNITVQVYPADKERPATLPTPGIATAADGTISGTKY